MTDTTGTSHDLTRVNAQTFEIVKRGPLYVEFRYSGRIIVEPANDVPFVMTVGMPNSKAWVKSSLVVEDPDRRLRELSFQGCKRFRLRGRRLDPLQTLQPGPTASTHKQPDSESGSGRGTRSAGTGRCSQNRVRAS